jgi:hypothetical protein
VNSHGDRRDSRECHLIVLHYFHSVYALNAWNFPGIENLLQRKSLGHAHEYALRLREGRNSYTTCPSRHRPRDSVLWTLLHSAFYICRASLRERPCRCMEEAPVLTNLATECVPSSALVSLCAMNFPLLTMFVCLLFNELGDDGLMPPRHRRPCEYRHM